jgi:4'-phosphopantetheinyl transferase
MNLPLGEIHVWKIEKMGPMDLLSSQEIDRAKSITHPEARNIFLKSRTALRDLAAQYSGKNPKDLEIHLSPNGKPFFPNLSDLFFNISHSSEGLAIAFSRREIGLDIEKINRPRSHLSIAKRFFSKSETAWLEADANGSAELFMKIWTAKEAMLKLSGDGIAHGLDRAVYVNESLGQWNGSNISLHRLHWPDFIGCVASFDQQSIVKVATYSESDCPAEELFSCRT